MMFNYWSIPMMLLLVNSVSPSAEILSAIAQMEMDTLVALLTAVQSGFVQLVARDCNDIRTVLGINPAQLAAAGKPNLTTVTIDLHSGTQFVTFNFTPDIATKILSSNLWDSSRSVAMFIPGFMATRNSPISRTMASRLSSLGLHNVLVVDPSYVLGWLYYYSATAVTFIGKALGKLLSHFYNAEVTNFHVIGHSLGAHISGFAGKTFYNLTGVKLDRISGLDPAGPCFYDESPGLRLSSTDAAFVDVIHSDAGTFGIVEPCGHVDFYPNGGSNQPNCLTFMCSHNKSWEFYSESFTTDAFSAVACADWFTFKTGACFANPRVPMGYATPVGTKGVYYLKTAATSPYGLGEKGITTPSTVDLVTALMMWWKSLVARFG